MNTNELKSNYALVDYYAQKSLIEIISGYSKQKLVEITMNYDSNSPISIAARKQYISMSVEEMLALEKEYNNKPSSKNRPRYQFLLEGEYEMEFSMLIKKMFQINPTPRRYIKLECAKEEVIYVPPYDATNNINK